MYLELRKEDESLEECVIRLITASVNTNFIFVEEKLEEIIEIIDEYKEAR